MIAEEALLGGEGNGGVIDPRVGFVRDSFVAMAMILDLMAGRDMPLSRLVAELAPVCMVKDQYPIPPGSASADAGRMSSSLWDRIASAFPDARADRRDGLRLEWDDRWVHVRASNTEPIVRVIAEAAEPAEARDSPAGSADGSTKRGGACDEHDRMAHVSRTALGRVRGRRRHSPGPYHHVPLRPDPLPPGVDPPLVLPPCPLSRTPASIRHGSITAD